jgi:hypothetical protein
MGYTPKVVGLMSCGFLLCLGLSTPAHAGDAAPAAEGKKADKPHARQPGDPRIGGQGGQGIEGKAVEGATDKPHARQPGDPRIGGQGGEGSQGKAPEGATDKPHTRQPEGPRVGGQGGQ